MPLTPINTKEIVTKSRLARRFAMSWFIVLAMFTFATIVLALQNINWTALHGWIVAIFMLFYGIAVLANAIRTKSIMSAFLQSHNQLVCPRDCSPITADHDTDICTCPICSIEIETDTLREFWNDTLATYTNWLRWLMHRKRVLAELPHTNPANPTHNIEPDSDAIASLITRARFLSWLFLPTMIVVFAWPSTGPNTFGFPIWLTGSFLVLIIACVIGVLSYVANDRAKKSLQKYIRTHHALVCPKDFYPLVEIDPKHQSCRCSECGMTTTRTNCQRLWQKALGSEIRWFFWLLFARPRIAQLPPSDAD